jgi:hypothetical protein
MSPEKESPAGSDGNSVVLALEMSAFTGAFSLAIVGVGRALAGQRGIALSPLLASVAIAILLALQFANEVKLQDRFPRTWDVAGVTIWISTVIIPCAVGFILPLAVVSSLPSVAAAVISLAPYAYFVATFRRRLKRRRGNT